MSEATLEGGCLCGAVRIEISGDPAAMAFCHCETCRSWLGAPVHAASLWPTPNVRVVRGEDKLAMFKKTEASHRQFCTSCGAPVLVVHPDIGLTDVPAGSIAGFDYRPALHVNYGEKVLAIRDGLPKFTDFPKDFGGSGETLPE